MNIFNRALGALAIVGVTLAGHGLAQAKPGCDEQADFAAAFEQSQVQGTFVLFDPETGAMYCHNAERARTRYLPASTFKIPNTLIALESGVASGPDFALPWNSGRDPRQAWWPQAWAKDHTLASALPNSVVWFYKELARRTGTARMQAYVDRFQYGNRDISGGIDTFWLTGKLGISAEEQVTFLHNFHSGKLGASERNTQIVKDLLVLEETPAYRLSGKTGWSGFGDATTLQTGWLVGYLERGEQVYFYATNVEIRKESDGAARFAVTKAILGGLGLM